MGRYTIRVPFYDDTYLNKKLTAQQTSFEVLRGKISAIISDSEIEEYRNGNITMASRLSSAIQTVDGFSQHVSSLESSYNAATGEFSSLKTKVSTFDQTVDGFTQQVASWERAEGKNAKDIKDIKNDYVLERNLVSKINQSADKIDLSVVNTSTLYSKTDIDGMFDNYTPTSELNRHIEQNKSELKLSETEILATVTGSSYWGDQAQAIIDLGDAKDEIAGYVDELKRTTAAKSTVYYGSTPPEGTTDNPLKTGDLWIDTNKNKNSLKRYNKNNNTWTAVDNTEIAEALKAAGDAQATADGKIQTFTGTAAQRDNTTKDLDIGDLWFTTDDDNKPFRWNGSRWIDIRDGAIETLVSDVKDAYDLADRKIATFYGSNEPQNPDTGDIWLQSETKTNTKTGKQYKETVIKRYNGSDWITIQDTGLETALNAAGDAQATADGKIETFFQPEPPTGTSANPLDHGDLWFDSDDNNKCYRYNKNKSTPGWEVVKDKRIEAAYDLAAKKVTTYYGTSIPSGVTPVAGDLWIDTTKDANNKVAKVLKRYNGSSWIVVDSPYLMEAYNTACDAADLADCKMQVFYEPGPTGPRKTDANQLDVGDLWIDSSEDGKNKVHRWNGTEWVSVQDGFIALAQETAENAQALAEKKVTTYTSRTEPTKEKHPELSDGDLWFTSIMDTESGAIVAKNIVKRWNESTSTWEDYSDSRLAEAITGIANLDDEKAQIFFQEQSPTNNEANKLDQGDLWIDTSEAGQNRIHIWNKTSKQWELADKALDDLIQWKSQAEISLTKDSIYETITTWDGGGMELVSMINQSPDGTKILGRHIQIEANDSITSAITNGSIKAYYDTKAPQTPKIGDIWYNTSSSNYKIYTYTTVNGTAQWVETEKDKVPKAQVINSINQSSEGTKIDAKKIEITAGSDIKIGKDRSTELARGMSRTFYTSTKPTQGTDSTTGEKKIKNGDAWYNTNTNKIYYWTGDTTKWQEDPIISRINLSTEGVYISGDRINIRANSEFTATAGTADNALSAANSANTAASNAQSTANTANTAASNANTLAGKKNTVFRQDKKPTANKIGDIWVDTSKSDTIKVWDGDEWQVEKPIAKINGSAEEGVTIDGNKVNINANTSYTATVNDINTSITNKAGAKSTIYRKDAPAPQGTVDNPLKAGDIWIDTTRDHGNQMYIYNGLSWEQDKIISRINLTNEEATISADKINIAASSSLKLMITGKNKIFSSDDAPVRVYDSTTRTYSVNDGDIWYDTDDNYKMRVYNNGWQVASKDLVPKSGVISAINLSDEEATINANKITLTAGAPLTVKLNDASGNSKVFRTPKQPTQSVENGIRNVAVGDIWYDTTSGKNKMYICSRATDTECDWTMDKIISRINMSDESIKIEAKRLAITAEDLGITAKNFRVQSTALSWSSTNSSMTEAGVLTCKSANLSQATVNGTITTENGNYKTIMTGGQLRTYYGNAFTSFIGSTLWNGTSSYYGTWMSAHNNAGWIGWAKKSSSDSDPVLKFVYTKTAHPSNSEYGADMLHTGCKLNLHNYGIINAGEIQCGNIVSNGNISAIGHSIRGRLFSSDGKQGLTRWFWVPDGDGYKKARFEDGLLVGYGD